jgi:hypothetical protein
VQRILEEMERALRRDRRLERRLRWLRRRKPSAGRIQLGVQIAAAVDGRPAVRGVRRFVMADGVIWAFAVVPPVTLYAVFRLLCRWTEP